MLMGCSARRVCRGTAVICDTFTVLACRALMGCVDVVVCRALMGCVDGAGKVTKLVGWNHHTQWPVTAASPTDAQMDADIVLLKKGNANYVRGAHYPHDPRMMDR